MLARPTSRALARCRVRTPRTSALCNVVMRPTLSSGYATAVKGNRHDESGARSAVINVLQNLGSKRE